MIVEGITNAVLNNSGHLMLEVSISGESANENYFLAFVAAWIGFANAKSETPAQIIADLEVVAKALGVTI